MSKKLFGKLNIVDILMVLILVAALSLASIKFLRPSVAAVESRSQKMIVTLYTEEVSDFVPDFIEIGDKLFDESKNCVMGTIKSITAGPSVYYGVNNDGKVVTSSRDGFVSLALEIEVQAELYDNGFIIGVTRYGINHGFLYCAGKTRIYGKVAGIKAE